MTVLWLVLVLALLASVFLAINRREFSPTRCPILLYHRFVRRPADIERYPGTEKIFTITGDCFEAQILLLKERGYNFLRLRDIHDIVALREPMPPRAVAITVDDGWTSDVEIMLPILRKHGVPAAFFVTTSPEAWIYDKFRGLDAPLSRDQVAALHEAGYEIGSHSVTHPHLIELPDDRIRKEFEESKKTLESITGTPCIYLSIPGNFYDRRIRRIAEECGYRAVFTADVGTVTGATELTRIPRLIVEGNFSLDEFESNLRPFAICTRKLIAALKKVPPRVLGATRYMAVRERLFSSPLRALFIMRRLKMIALVLALAAVTAAAFLLTR
ncbi:MAG: polysaccharide deacetylase family protein [Gemmatimonadota bacterium]